MVVGCQGVWVWQKRVWNSVLSFKFRISNWLPLEVWKNLGSRKVFISHQTRGRAIAYNPRSFLTVGYTLYPWQKLDVAPEKILLSLVDRHAILNPQMKK